MSLAYVTSTIVTVQPSPLHNSLARLLARNNFILYFSQNKSEHKIDSVHMVRSHYLILAVVDSHHREL